MNYFLPISKNILILNDLCKQYGSRSAPRNVGPDLQSILFEAQYQMRGKSSCRKHSIHSRQPPEQHKTKARKQHECIWLQKHRRHTETNKHLLRERWEYRLGTVSAENLYCME